ncbi:MAG: MBL fold metallo-hydrolase [Candidatus Lokiarchaeota archaeon]|nr:MBL fold metallo-hydrolase [Candidatus Lokiarchaeota archaeon]MBD3198862.1 MBL fold metallo-hydrolase [Candidatus Lokiarchaeota archaeon]
MVSEPILLKNGKVNDYIYHIDLKEFGKERILSSYVAEFDDESIIMDCGSSLEVNRLLRYLKRQDIPLDTVKYLIPTHHHFDHNGGMWKLYERIKKYNPEAKILTNTHTQDLLNNYETHLTRAKRTFGNFIGEMHPIEEKAFELINPSENFGNSLDQVEIIDTFEKNGEEISLKILKTPGHTPDHQTPLFINKNNEIEFIFLGEAVGTIYHSEELVTMPTSMPVYFNYNDYMNSLSQIESLKAEQAGFCHFGVVNGKKNVAQIINDNKNLMELFKNKIIEFYNEKPETRYVYNKIMPYLTPRTDLVEEDHPIMKNIVLGIVYGMLMDLGFRND